MARGQRHKSFAWTGKTGDWGGRTEFYVLKFYVLFLLPKSASGGGAERATILPHFCLLGLRSRRPATGVSRALRARSVPEVSPRVSPKMGGVRGSVRRGSRDTFWTLWSPGPEGPRGHPVGHSLGHPPFSGTLSWDTPGTLRARRARETPVAGRRDRNTWVITFRRFF